MSLSKLFTPAGSLTLTSVIAAPLAVFSGIALTAAFLLVGVSCAYKAIRNKVFDFIYLPIFFAVGLFLLWAIASSFWSLNPMVGIDVWVRYSFLVILGFLSVKMLAKITKEQQKLLCWSFILSIVLICGFNIIELYSDGMITRLIRTQTRGEGFKYDPHFLNRGSSYLALLIWPVLLAVKQLNIRLTWLVSILLWFSVCVLLYHLSSTSSLLGFVLGSVAFLIVYLSKGKLSFLITIGTLMIIIAIPLFFSQGGGKALIKHSSSIPDSALHRLYIWDYASEKAAEKSLFGWGIRSSRYIPGADERVVPLSDHTRERMPQHPHNFVLQIWLELGVVGVILFAGLIYSLFKVINRLAIEPIEKAAYTSALITFLVLSMFSYELWRNWWFSAGLIVLCQLASLTLPAIESDSKQN